MYYVLNADGTRYGPVPQGTLEEWSREGRIADTARFLDAVTEQPVERGHVLLSTAPSAAYNMPPTPYPSAPQGQAYQARRPSMQDAPSSYNAPYNAPQSPGYSTSEAPRPHLTGQTSLSGQGNPGHNPVTATLLCFLLFVAGYIYNKQIVKGVVLMVAVVAAGMATGGIGGWVLLLVGMVDCYKIAQRIRAGETVGQWQFF